MNPGLSGHWRILYSLVQWSGLTEWTRERWQWRVLSIPQSSSITGTSLSDCLVSYPRHSLWWGSYPSAEKRSVFSTAPTDWVRFFLALRSLLMPSTINDERPGRKIIKMLVEGACNGYHHGKRNRPPEFKPWMRLFAFHIALIHKGKVWIQLIFQRWVTSKEDLGTSGGLMVSKRD